MAVIGEMFVAVRPKTQGFQKETEQGLKSQVIGAAKSLAIAAGGAFAAIKIFDFGKQALEEAATVQKASEEIRAQYGKSAGGILDFSNTAAQAYNISTAASREFSAQVGLTAQNLGISHGKAAEMDIGLQSLAGAVGKVKGVDPSGYFQKLSLALLGNTRGLKQMGISVDPVTLKLEELKLGFLHSATSAAQLALDQKAVKKAQDDYNSAIGKYGKGSTQALTAAAALSTAQQKAAADTAKTTGTVTGAQKAQAIYGVAISHLGELQKEARKHSRDYADEILYLKAVFDNVKLAVGRFLLGGFTPLVQFIAKNAPAALKALSDGWNRFIAAIRPITTYIRTQVVGALLAMVATVKNLIPVLTPFARVLGGVLLVALAGLATTVRIVADGFQILSAALALIPPPLLEGLALAVGGVTLAIIANEAATLALAAADTIASAAFAAFTAAVSLSPFGIAVIAIAVLVASIYELYKHSATARRIIKEAFAGIKVAARDLEAAFRVAVGFILRLWARWGSDIKAVARVALAGVVFYVRTYFALVKGAFNLIGDIIHGRWGKIWDDVVKLVKTVPSKLLPIFGDLARFVYKQAVAVGKKLVEGAVAGIKKLGSDIKDTASHYLHEGLSALTPGSTVYEAGGEFISTPLIKGSVDTLSAGGSGLRDQMTNTINPALRSVGLSAFLLNLGQGHQAGAAFTTGTVSGVQPLQASLSVTIINACKRALAAARSALGISSPSKLFADELGRPLAEGIIAGMGGLEKGLASKLIAAARTAAAVSGGLGGGVSGTAATGANQKIGYQMMLAAGWSADQWGSLQALWNRESGWNQFARNPSSGAFGIPQELGHTVSAAYLAGDVRAQIAWGLDYIRGRYGSPALAWAHEVKAGWYEHGGLVEAPRGQAVPGILHGGEFVLTAEQLSALREMAHVLQGALSPGASSGRGRAFTINGGVQVLAQDPADFVLKMNQIASKVAPAR